MPISVRERLIVSAATLIARRGVAGAGVAELLARSHASRRSIYMHFPGGKGDLVDEATRVSGTIINTAIGELNQSDDPAAAVEAFGLGWQNSLLDSNFEAGCPIVAAALGRYDAPSAADTAGAVFADWADTLTTRMHARGLDTRQAHSLAITVVAGIEGAVIISIAQRTTEPIVQVTAQLAQLVRAQLAV